MVRIHFFDLKFLPLFIMMNVFFLIFCLLFSFATFFEFIVFNEEILLTLCFLFFLFSFYHYVRKTVQTSFNEQFENFKQSYFEVLKAKFNFVNSYFFDLVFLKDLTTKLHVYETLILRFALTFVSFLTNNSLVLTTLSSTTKDLLVESKSKKHLVSKLLFAKLCSNILLSSLLLKCSSNAFFFPKKQKNIFKKVQLV